MSNEVAKAGSQLPEHLRAAAKADAGKGVSRASEDNMVPLVYILQSNSPQVNKRGEAYIDGAEAGDIWLRNAPSPIVKGAEGFIFQPCYFVKEILEWIPRDDGGGFVGRHATLPEDAVEEKDEENPNRKIWKMPNGNELIETRSHIGNAIFPDGTYMPFVIPLKSTGHSTSRQWMVMMNAKGADVPSWAFYYKLKTRHRTNKSGEWFAFDVLDHGACQTEEEMARGKALYEAFASGAKTTEVDTSRTGDEETKGKF